MALQWDAANPLQRTPGETRKSNIALGDYWRMGPGRSLGELARQYRNNTKGAPTGAPTLQLSRLKKWSTRYAWQARIDGATELQQEQDEQEWLARRRQIREREWDISNKLSEKAEAMLRFPVSRQVVRDTDEAGRPITTTIEPADWRMSDVPRLADTASKLARRAAEMEESKAGLDVTAVFTVVREGPETA